MEYGIGCNTFKHQGMLKGRYTYKPIYHLDFRVIL